MSVDDFDDSRRLAPVWRRIMILLTVIAAVPVILWSITAFVRAYVAPPTVPTFRPITTTASVPAPVAAPATSPVADAAAPAAPAKALAAIVRNAATEDANPAAQKPPIIEAKATMSDARGLAPVADGNKAPVSDAPAAPSPAAQAEAPAPPAMAPPPSPWPAAPAEAATPPTPSPATPPAAVADEALPAGDPIVGPVPLPPHRPHLFAMVQGGIPVPRPRPAAAGDTPTVAPADLNLSSRDYMR